jgi:hypothetical protein
MLRSPVFLPFAAAFGLLGLAACGTTTIEPVSEEAIEQAIPEGYVRTGETQTCLNTTRIEEIDPVGDRVWIVELRGGERYLNVVSPGCDQADSAFTYLFYDVPSAQLCRGEIIQVRQQTANIGAGSCGLGEFERLERAGE